MTKATHKQARLLIEEQATFTASSVFAIQYPRGYVVFSYGHHFPMFACVNDRDGSRKWFVNVRKYSTTTSKHTTTLRPRGVSLTPSSHDTMLGLHRAIARGDAHDLACYIEGDPHHAKG